MSRVLFLLFILLPMLEIALILEIGEQFGGWTTLALIILSAWIGVKLVRQQGISTLTRIQENLAQGKMPSEEITSGLMILVSGAFMLTPGFITDAFGLFLLWPQGRIMLSGFVQKNILAGRVQQVQPNFYYHQENHYSQGNTYEHEEVKSGTVIDVEPIEHKDNDKNS